MSKETFQLVRYLSEEGETSFAIFDSMQSWEQHRDKLVEEFGEDEPERFIEQFSSEEISAKEQEVLVKLLPYEQYEDECGTISVFVSTYFW